MFHYVLCALAGVLSMMTQDEALEHARAMLTEENIAAIEQGETVSTREKREDEEGDTQAHGVAVVLIDGPPDAVWKHLTDHENQPEFMPRLISKEIYFQEENRTGFREVIKVALRKFENHVIQHLYPEKHLILFELDHDQENDIKDTSGCWVLFPHGEGQTIAVYTVYVRSGVMLPKFIQNFLMQRDLPDVPESLKKRVESDGAYTK